MANALLLGQAANAGQSQGVGVLANSMAQGQNMAAQRQQMQQSNALFQQQQQDRAQEDQIAPVREDLAAFLMTPDESKQQVWGSGLAQHYGLDGNKPWQEGVLPFVQNNPRVLGPELSQKIIGKYAQGALGGAEGAPMSVQEYEYFNRLPPEGKQQFMTLRRAAKTIDLGGSQAVLSPDGSIAQQYQKGVAPQDQPQFKQQQAEASARGKALGEVEEKKPALDSFGIAKTAMLDSIAKTPTGGWMGAVGQSAKVTDYQAVRQFEQRVQQLSTEIRTVFRIPGEGTLTNQEQAQYGIQLPDIRNDKEINDQIMAELEQRVMARMRQPMQQQAPAQQPGAKRRYNPQTGKIE